MSPIIGIFLTLSSAVLLTLSFPTFDLGFLAWFGLVPFFIAVKGKSLRMALTLSYLLGSAFFFGVFFWINSVKGLNLLHYAVLGFYLGLYFPLSDFFSILSLGKPDSHR